jgi:hypothetical protein
MNRDRQRLSGRTPLADILSVPMKHRAVGHSVMPISFHACALVCGEPSLFSEPRHLRVAHFGCIKGALPI